ncbi:MAG TPA: G5 domain-containing protein [Candidatus Dojkabacteria bacterium]|nr:G5 domain-containing protein [Candidatus Dojkabacteria bacterium]
MDPRIRYNGYIRSQQNKNTWTRVPLILISIILLGLMFSSGSVYADYRSDNQRANLISMMYGNTPLLYKDSSLKLVSIVDEGRTIKYLTNSLTVSSVLEENNITLDSSDYTVPDINSALYNNETIKIVHRNYELATQVEPIAFTTLKVDDDRVLIGTTVIKQKGKNGLRQVNLKRIFENGKLKEEIVISTKVMVRAINEEIHIGTKPETIQSCPYWDKIIDEKVDPKNKTKNTWMKFIMRKETWCDSGQVTPTKTPGLSYYGLYQFTPRMFRARGGVNIFDGEEQIMIVSGMYDQGESYRNLQWGTSNTRFHQLYPDLK